MALVARDRLWLWLGLGLVALLGLRDVSNPDVFWHLLVGARIVAERRLPSVESFSHMRAGAPWQEYEWLIDLVWLGADALAGGWGLVAVKLAFMVGGAAFVARAIKGHGWGGQAQCAAVLGLAAGWVIVGDARPDNASIFFACATLWALELGRAGKLGPRARWGFLLGSALWTNLHPGFVYGAGLVSLYALEAYYERRPRDAKLFGSWLLCGLLGAMISPIGPRVFLVLGQHAGESEEVRRYINEWKPSRLSSGHCAWLWVFMGLGAATLAYHARRLKRFDPLPWALMIGTAIPAVLTRRAIPFFVIPTIVVGSRALAEAIGRRPPPRLDPRLAGAAALAAALAWAVAIPKTFSRGGYDLRSYPVAAAGYLELNSERLSGLKMYNPLGWGGYLARRLWPGYRVYIYGSSAFVGMLRREDLLYDTPPPRWQETLERNGIGLAVMHQKLPDIGGRPYHETFMPRERWTPIFSDDVAIVFVRRAK